MGITSIKINNIYDLIEMMKTRPAMYIGDKKISSMRSFIEGYKTSSQIHNIKSEKVFPPFWYFHEWANEKYGWDRSTAGWKNVILEENGFDEEKALEVFFQMIDEFKTLHAMKIQKVIMGNHDLQFRVPSKSAIKGEDVFEKVDEMFLVEYSHNFGFSYFVRSKNVLLGLDWVSRFKDENLAKERIEKKFGFKLDWEPVPGDLKIVMDEIIKSDYLG